MNSLIYPPALKQDDLVIIVSPSGKIERCLIDDAFHFFESEGWKVRVSAHADGAYASYSGTIEERLSDLQAAMDDMDAKAIFCSRGGYGAVHLLEHLRFENFKQHPKWLVGYSDITALHSLYQQQGFASIHAPMAKHLSEEPVDDEATQLLLHFLRQDIEGVTYEIDAHPYNHQGMAKGILRGGNLAVAYGLRGTPYDILAENTILYIEDVGEKPHAIERMIYNLKLGGVLEHLSGLIIGQFTEYKENYGLGKELYGAIADVVKEYNYPICFDFPVGHIQRNLPMINGAMVEFEVNDEGANLTFNIQ